VLLTEYRGMKVGELADLRTQLRKVSTDYKVVKNTLATLAVRQVGLEELAAMLEGPVAIAFVDGDPVQAAKEITDFAKRAPTLTLKGGVLAGKVLSEADAKGLATLESREVLLAKTVGMFVSPLQQMANLFAAPLRNLGSALAQLKDKQQAEQPAA
jgi:large subunit ribosomal protein L10